MIRISTIALVVFSLWLYEPDAAAARQPNIVILLADDSDSRMTNNRTKCEKPASFWTNRRKMSGSQVWTITANQTELTTFDYTLDNRCLDACAPSNCFL